MELFTNVEVNAAQAEAMGRAMLAVARADGSADPREVALIEELDVPVGFHAGGGRFAYTGPIPK